MSGTEVHYVPSSGSLHDGMPDVRVRRMTDDPSSVTCPTCLRLMRPRVRLRELTDALREGLRPAGPAFARALNHMTCHAATVSGVPDLPPDFLPNSLGAYPSALVCDWDGCPVRGEADDIPHCFLAKPTEAPR